MTEEARKVLERLDEFGIVYECIEHEAVYTSLDCPDIEKRLGTQVQKNLFLRNKQKDRFFIVILDNRKRFCANKLVTELGLPKLSFGDEGLLWEKLGLVPGCVSPFGLLNNKDVTLVIDSDVMEEPRLSFHPNSNMATLSIAKEEFEKYLRTINVQPLICKL